jgi:hypothetical protein
VIPSHTPKLHRFVLVGATEGLSMERCMVPSEKCRWRTYTAIGLTLSLLSRFYLLKNRCTHLQISPGRCKQSTRIFNYESTRWSPSIWHQTE